MRAVTVNFTERYEGTIPNTATYGGIYAVYAYNKNQHFPRWVLLDIGQAENVYLRHQSHERAREWSAFAERNGMVLIYYVARLSNEDKQRDMAEAALIFRFQPQCESQCKNGYHHEDVVVQVEGRLQNAMGRFVQLRTDA